MVELEQQVAEHNILQREIEAYGQQLRTLVGPVGASPSSLVGIPLPPIIIRLDSLAIKGELRGRDVGGGPAWWGSHHTKPRFSLWLTQDANTIRNQYRDLLVSWARMRLWVGPLCLNPWWVVTVG